MYTANLVIGGGAGGASILDYMGVNCSFVVPESCSQGGQASLHSGCREETSEEEEVDNNYWTAGDYECGVGVIPSQQRTLLGGAIASQRFFSERRSPARISTPIQKLYDMHCITQHLSASVGGK